MNATYLGIYGDFSFHHQPFVYFERFQDPNSSNRREHLKDEEDFFYALRAGTLGQVSFVKPYSTLSFHPEFVNPTRMIDSQNKVRK